MKKIPLAVIPSFGLGDNIIYLLLAQNLARNGLDVTFIANHTVSLQAWLPTLKCIPFPPPEKTDELLDTYDLILSDASSILTKNRTFDQKERAVEKTVFISTLTIADQLIEDHAERLEDLFGTVHPCLKAVASASGRMRPSQETELSLVEQTIEYCMEQLSLDPVATTIDFNIPEHLVYRQQLRRVLLHPSSYSSKKNWPLAKYIKLAKRLQKKGYQPLFLLSPKEREQWASPVVAAGLEIADTPDIESLAELMYCSGYLIGNDSGNGHLASALGIPVLTVHRKSSDPFHWRPGWGQNAIVRPVMAPKLFGKKIWTPFLSVGRAERAFHKLIRTVDAS